MILTIGFVTFFLVSCFFFFFWDGVLALALGWHGMNGLGLGWCYTDGQGDFRFSFFFLVTRILNYGSYTV